MKQLTMKEANAIVSEGLRTRWRVSVCYGKHECLLYATDREKVGRKKTYRRFIGCASGAAIINGVLRITLAPGIDGRAIRHIEIAEAEP